MSLRSSASRRTTEERRVLVRALFELFRKHGGRVILPADQEEEALFDALPIPELVTSLRTGQYLDVGELLKGEASRPFPEGVDPDIGTPRVLSLEIALLEVTLDEHELQELAFMLFCLFCEDSSDLTKSVRRQLELSDSSAEDIAKIATKIRPQLKNAASPTELGVELLLKLIKEVRPEDFCKFRDFVEWRDALARVLIQITKASLPDAELPRPMARLKGALRRLCFQDKDDFEEQEYADAILAVGSIVEKLEGVSDGRPCGLTWGLRMNLWETFLVALFEPFEDAIYIDEKDRVEALLQKELAPRLGISGALHNACFAWVHYRELRRSLFPGLCFPVKTLMSAVAAYDPPREEMDRVYVAEVLRVCRSSLTETLMDYHSQLPESNAVAGMVELFLSLTQTIPNASGSTPSLEDCIASSCVKAFQRLFLKGKTEDDSHVRLTRLAQETSRLYEKELLVYTGGFAEYCPAAAGVAAKVLHDCFGQELKPVLYELKAIPSEVVDMLKAADALEERLLGEIPPEEVSAKTVVPWNVMDVTSDLLDNWVDVQLHNIKKWRERLLQEETWQPLSKTDPLSASAVEFKRLLGEAITLVFSLDLSFPEARVNRFVKGLADAVEAYVSATLSDIRGKVGIDLLVPRVPELTRYKKDLADSAALKEQRSAENKPHKRHSRLKSILLDSSVNKMVPLIEDCENFQWFNNLKMHALIVRINSLQFLKDSIPELSRMVEDQSNSHGVWQQIGKDSSAEPLWTAAVALERGVDLFCEFLGTKLVFWDGRVLWLEQIYRHSVVASRLELLMPDLLRSLSDITAVALTSTRDKIAFALLESCVQCLKRVLLEGGPYRLFKSGSAGNDQELIEEDVKKLKDLFNDRGEGLPMTKIEEALKPVFEILLHMSLTTPNLIQLAEEARKNSSRDFPVYTHILGHRADRAASKWLKKTLKTPKKTKSKI